MYCGGEIMVGHRGTLDDARNCKDWPWRHVTIKMRARNEKQMRELIQFAFDNYFLHEAKMIHFGSPTVPIGFIEEVE